MVRNTDKNELYKMFLMQPISVFDTRGIGAGIIIQFRTFYLKIYDHQKDDAYIVEGYNYNKPRCILRDIIPLHYFRSYASQFTEDYLTGYQ